MKTRGFPAGVEERSAGLTKFPSTLAPNSKRSKNEQKETFNSKRHPIVDATEVILEDMRRWYEDRLDHEDISDGWKQVQQCLFKKVTVRVPADDRRITNLGAAQPEEESERQVMVVSKEFCC